MTHHYIVQPGDKITIAATLPLNFQTGTVTITTTMPDGAQSSLSEPVTLQTGWVPTFGIGVVINQTHTYGELGPDGPGHYVAVGVLSYNQGQIYSQFMSEDWDLATAVSAPTPGPTPTPPPSLPGTTPPPSSPFPMPPNSINPIDWIKWIGLVLQWMVGQIWIALGDALSYLLNLTWSLLPDWAQKGVTAFVNVWGGIFEFFTDPTAWFEKLLIGTTVAKSPSILEKFLASVAGFIATLQIKIQPRPTLAVAPQTDPISEVKELGAKIGALIAQPINPEGVQARIQELDTLVTQLFLSLYTAQQLAEDIPFLNKTGSTNFALSWLEARGIFQAIRGTLEPYLRRNIDAELAYKLNETYKNVLPSQGELERLRDLGKITPDYFTLIGQRSTGISGDVLELIRRSKHQRPGLEDYFTFNFRHPETAIDIATIQDLVNVDWAEYKTILEERQFNDLSIRFILSAAEILDFDEPKVKELFRLNHLDPRINSVLGDSPLNIATKVVMGRKATFDLKQEPREAKSKHFTYSQLIKLAEAGEDVTGFMTPDLTAEGWDDAHRLVLEDYINKTVAAKAAKTIGAPPI